MWFRLPGLQFLDATDVTAEKPRLQDADRLGKKARPTPKKKTVEHDAALAANRRTRLRKEESIEQRSQVATSL